MVVVEKARRSIGVCPARAVPAPAPVPVPVPVPPPRVRRVTYEASRAVTAAPRMFSQPSARGCGVHAGGLILIENGFA